VFHGQREQIAVGLGTNACHAFSMRQKTYLYKNMVYSKLVQAVAEEGTPKLRRRQLQAPRGEVWGGGSGERRKLCQRGPGWAPAEKEFYA